MDVESLLIYYYELKDVLNFLQMSFIIFLLRNNIIWNNNNKSVILEIKLDISPRCVSPIKNWLVRHLKTNKETIKLYLYDVIIILREISKATDVYHKLFSLMNEYLIYFDELYI